MADVSFFPLLYIYEHDVLQIHNLKDAVIYK